MVEQSPHSQEPVPLAKAIGELLAPHGPLRELVWRADAAVTDQIEAQKAAQQASSKHPDKAAADLEAATDALREASEQLKIINELTPPEQ